MRKNGALAKLEPGDSVRDHTQLQEIARRGMRANVEYMELIRDQLRAHRLAAAASTLPRLQAHFSALADELEQVLGAGGDHVPVPVSMVRA